MNKSKKILLTVGIILIIGFIVPKPAGIMSGSIQFPKEFRCIGYKFAVYDETARRDPVPGGSSGSYYCIGIPIPYPQEEINSNNSDNPDTRNIIEL